ncbi:MAG: hypothetical protein KA319_06390 [Ferruginibacter sp.]|nr:hypothetical protein [Ferruginibacter sp.]
MKHIVITVILALSVFTSFSQYGDAYHAANTFKLDQMRQQRIDQNDAIHRSHINASSEFYISKSGYYGSYETPWFLKKKEVPKKAKTAAELKKEAEYQEWVVNERAERSLHNSNVKEASKIFTDVGFDRYDATIILNDLVYDKSKSTGYYSSEAERAILWNLKYYKIEFEGLFKTATYEILIEQVKKYIIAPYTAFKDLEKLIAKFPENRKECELLQLNCIEVICGNHFYTNDFNKLYDNTYHNNEMLNKFLYFESKYPIETSRVAGAINDLNFSPYILLAEYAIYGKREKVAAAFLLKQFISIHPPNPFSEENVERLISPAFSRNFFTLKNRIIPRSKFEFLKNNPKYLKDFTKDDWDFIAKQYDMSTIAFFDVLTGSEYGPETSQLMTSWPDSYDTYNCSFFNFGKLDLTKIILECSKDTTAEALNAMGLCVANNKTKLKPYESINYFKMAADKGYIIAAKNYLTVLSNKKSKNYDVNKQKEAEEYYKNYKVTTAYDKFLQKYAKL